MLPLACALVAGASIVGCASSPPLRTVPAPSGIRAAQEAGAATEPRAALLWQLAKEELESARGFRAEGNEAEGASMLLRAQADGELAVALSRNTAQASEAEVAAAHTYVLQQDNERGRALVTLQWR
jgi:hypothetical protein